jgi:hypothetical protein
MNVRVDKVFIELEKASGTCIFLVIIIRKVQKLQTYSKVQYSPFLFSLSAGFICIG